MDGAPTVTDLSAVERSYREQGERLWRAVFLFCADREVASDAVAEAFAQALRRQDAIRDVDRWVWRSAFAIARGELKRRRGNTELIEIAVEMPPSAVDVLRALTRLSPKQRAAMVLHHYAGYSNRETAALIGSTPAAVGVHLERARARLRDLLEDRDG
jgi:RNA polymerase sigma-70 factor (ECF subfamily)